MQIKTFEELFEEVKKLLRIPIGNIRKYYSSKYRKFDFIFEGEDEYYVKIKEKDYLKEGKIEKDYCLLFIFYYHNGKYEKEVEICYTKDPQKIYNIIKAIKECENKSNKRA